MTTDNAVALPDTNPLQVEVTPAMVSDLKHQVQALDAAYTLSKSLCKTVFAPKQYRDKPEDGAVAIMYGQRLGLDAIQSLQNVFVVHGTPSTYAKVMKAKLQIKGHRIKTVESTDKRAVVRGWRAGALEDDFEESVWTIERAIKAGYVPQVDPKTGKFKVNQYGKLIGNEKYLTDPTTMLYSRATSECCRRTAPEEILGIYDVNEMRDEERLVRTVVSERADQPSGASIIAARTPTTQQPAQQPATPADPDPDPVDVTELMPDENQDRGPVEQPTSESRTEPEPSQISDSERPSAEQVKELTRLLRNERLTTRKAQVEWLDSQIHERTITALEDLTPSECDEAIGFLATEQARDAEGGDQ